MGQSSLDSVPADVRHAAEAAELEFAPGAVISSYNVDSNVRAVWPLCDWAPQFS